jgi:2-polyprenyl-3-methyl-5-hydroxy-6-metoxy-1,4-benzoquinol methylase
VATLADAPAAPSTAPVGSLEPVDQEVFGALQRCLDGLLSHVRPVRVLDAGCGHRLYVPIAEERYVLGIDVEPAQLRDDLDEAIVGDLQSYDLGRERFDAIICWNVLEHVADPPVVLHKFVDALAAGGVIILALPHVASVKGLVTKYSPQWFHDWVWAHLLGAGPTHDAFPTVLSRSLTPRRLAHFARESGLSVEFLAEYEAWSQKRIRRKLRLRGRAFQAVVGIVRALTFGRITIAATDVVFVVRKPPR